MTFEQLHPNDCARMRHALRYRANATVEQLADDAGVDIDDALVFLAGPGASCERTPTEQVCA